MRSEAIQGAPHDYSAEVQAFYERHPYPAPLKNLDDYSERWANLDRRLAGFHLYWPAKPYREDLTILVAGCGTSQAAKHAMRHPAAQVTGIDISESSLQHTRELKQKYRLDNLELLNLPLERVQELDQKFDKIICTGVLHHLPDPDIGLRALRGMLVPDGAMHLMVYASYGRTGIYMLQEYCRLMGVRATGPDLEALSETLGALPQAHPLAHLLRHAKDFRSPAALADALLHPQDRAYTVADIYDWLDACGLSFSRWSLQAPYLPQCGAVVRTPHAERLRSLPAAQQHAALELFRGTMVKHEFTAVCTNQPGQFESVGFDGDGWPGYVPIRMPATIVVRERLPAGAAAVLLNPAHPFTDIFLPINRTEEKLFSAIDGTHNINEILRTVSDKTRDPVSRDDVRQFFERLWFYDQIVLDASRA